MIAPKYTIAQVRKPRPNGFPAILDEMIAKRPRQ